VKTASTALAALINSSAFYCADLYTFASTLGPVVRLTTADFDVIDNSGNVYSSGSIGSGSPKIDLKQSRVQGHWTRGLDPGRWLVALLPTTQDPFTLEFTYPDVVGGTPWLAACRAGVFDGATCVVQRAYWAAPPAVPFTALSRTCVGTLIVFSGLVGPVDSSQTITFFTINDYRYLLGMNMPRNHYQSSCRNMLGDARCTVNLASYANAATALAGSTEGLLIASPAAPGGSGSYNLGVMAATSGANSGFSRTIAAWTPGTPQTFQPQNPFPLPIAAGDGFSFTPGCDKSMGATGCAGFANIAHFRGEPYIPVPETQIG
jgi:uncharacterized phage protein (TIGR02218 family)